jgi:hypothetical protein
MAKSSAMSPSAFAVSRAPPRLGDCETAHQDLVLGLQGLDGGFEDAHKRQIVGHGARRRSPPRSSRAASPNATRCSSASPATQRCPLN